MKFLNRNIVFKSITRTLKILPKTFRKKSVFVLIFMIISSMLDLFGIASIFPVLLLVVKRDAIENNEILNSLYNYFEFQSHSTFVIALACLAVVILLFKNLIYFLNLRYQAGYAMGVFRYLTSRLVEIYFDKGYYFIRSNNTNQLAKQMTMYPRVFSSTFLMPLLKIISELVILSVVLGFLVVFYSKFILSFIYFIVPVFYIFYRFSRNKLSIIDKSVADLTYKSQHSLFDILNANADVRIHNVFDYFKNRFEGNIAKESRFRILGILYSESPVKIIEFGLMVAILSLFLSISFSDIAPEKTIEMLGIFGLAAFRSVPSMNRIATSILKLKSSEFTFQSLEKITTEFADEKINEELSFESEIEFKNVSYAYEDEQLVLEDLNINIAKGSATGIMGGSGSGKTTFINLFLGLLQPSTGDILVDNVGINDSNLGAWQEKIAYVQQDVFILDDTLINNIAFGDQNPNIEFVNELIDKVSLGGFVSNLKDGLKTNVGEKGARISGGQKQRVGIARALYKNPEILVFDESTSALDEKTEDEIIDLIRNLSDKNMTTLIVSHRPRTFKFCNNVIDLEKLNRVSMVS